MRLRDQLAPVLPTSLEAFLFAVYPATLLLGSIFAALDPSSRSAPYDANMRAHPPYAAPSFFAHKTNIFNALFVKVGWLWTTVAFLPFLFTYGGPVYLLTPRRVQGLVRYALITAWWYAATQWFFGPALIDRIFVVTGGLCRTHEGVATGAACKAIGGVWVGGHDPSGHVFMLSLASLFLWMEVLPVRLRCQGVDDERYVSDGLDFARAKRAEIESQMLYGLQPNDPPAPVAFRVILSLAGLWWWMLLMTAIYFHSWFEKVRISGSMYSATEPVLPCARSLDPTSVALC